MIKEITIYRNEDARVAVELYFDQYTPANVSPNTPTPKVSQVKAYLYVGSQLVKAYALSTPATDEGTLKLDTEVYNRVQLLVTRDESKDFPIGQLNYVVHADFVDADFPSGRREVFKGVIGIVADNPAASAI